MMTPGHLREHGPGPIPDKDPDGVVSTIMVPDSGEISTLAVHVDITHTYRGDLKVVLLHDGREATLHDRTGGGEDDLRQTFMVTDMQGDDCAGDWTLVVVDAARADTGTLESWSLAFE